jgi:hypothetical protein
MGTALVGRVQMTGGTTACIVTQTAAIEPPTLEFAMTPEGASRFASQTADLAADIWSVVVGKHPVDASILIYAGPVAAAEYRSTDPDSPSWEWRRGVPLGAETTEQGELAVAEEGAAPRR